MRIEDQKLYCYLPGYFVRNALNDQSTIDKVVQLLEVPGKEAHLRKLPLEEKKAAVEVHATHLAKLKTSLYYGVEPPEIIAAHMLQLTDRKGIPIVFSPVKKEADLLAPIAAWLSKQSNFDVFKEVPMGTKRVDVLGYRKGGFFRSELAVAVELKNEIEQLKRGLDQMTTFCEYAHRVYLACTPFMAAEYLAKHAKAKNVQHWDPEVLNNKLRKIGLGLLIVRNENVEEVIAPKETTPNGKKFKEILSELSTRLNEIK